MTSPARPIGHLLREWRQRRRLSQLDLAGEANISSRHLSFVETGRSIPSREMVLHLAERLNLPLRERNVLLLAAGYAPVFPERPLGSPVLGATRRAVELILTGHEPYPALAVNRHWTLVSANRAVAPLLAGVTPALLEPPVNVLRLSLHPQGLAPRIANLAQWREHLLFRLRSQVDLTADPVLTELLGELQDYPGVGLYVPTLPPLSPEDPGVVVPLQLVTDAGVLALFSTTTVFGTPLDVTLSELALESFFPADHETAERLRRLTGPPSILTPRSARDLEA
jgi:transcriptional regulator with XRE-family HTH domain